MNSLKITRQWAPRHSRRNVRRNVPLEEAEAGGKCEGTDDKTGG